MFLAELSVSFPSMLFVFILLTYVMTPANCFQQKDFFKIDVEFLKVNAAVLFSHVDVC